MAAASYSLIMNPSAGKGRAGRELVRLRSVLQHHDVEVDVFLTEAAGDAERIVRGLDLEEGAVVIAAGGDGTVHEVGEALLDSEHGSLAVLPFGSGNDYASLLGMPLQPDAALAAIVNGVDVRWDVGQIGPHVFLNTVGFGFSASVSYHSIHTGPLRGLARYGLAVARAFFGYRPTVLHFDGLKAAGRQTMTLMEVGIGNRCGGGFYLTADADPCDGLLDVCIVKAIRRIEMPFLLPLGLKGKHIGHAKVIYEQSSGFRLALDSDQMIHVDGDIRILPAGEYSARVRAQALRVRLPYAAPKEAS